MSEVLPDHAELLHGYFLGNRLYLVSEGGAQRVLKVFLPRRGAAREAFGSLSHRLFEGKRGTQAAERRETERRSLELWAEHGFDVPRLLEGERPDWAPAGPHLWLEYTPGALLWDVLADAERPQSEREALARRLGEADARRHRLALERREPLLLQEHPTTKHVLVHGERLVTIDLEHGYQPRYSPLAAVTRELAGVIRSLWQRGAPPPLGEGIPRAYLEGYGDRELLERAARLALSWRPGWLGWRVSDRWRRGDRSKAEVMVRLERALRSGDLEPRGPG